MINFYKSLSILFIWICSLVSPTVISAATVEGLDDKLDVVESKKAPWFDGAHWINTDQQNGDFLQGKVVLVNFWATWCPPCIEELPSLQRLRDSYSHAEFEVVAVNVSEDEETILGFLAKFSAKLEFPIIVDLELEIFNRWEVRPLPTTLVVDREGNIRYQAVGGRNFDSKNIRSLLSNLLAEKNESS